MTDNKAHKKTASSTHKHFFHKKLWSIGAIVVLLFLSGAVGSWLFVANQQKSPTQEKVSPESKRALAINTTTTEAQNLANNGKTEQAQAVYDTAISQTNDTYQKSILLMNKATILFNNNDYDGALVIAQQAESMEKNSTVTQFIAQIYEKKGDNQKAIEYYQKTITLVSKTNPLYKSDIKYCQAKIAELGGAKG